MHIIKSRKIQHLNRRRCLVVCKCFFFTLTFRLDETLHAMNNEPQSKEFSGSPGGRKNISGLINPDLRQAAPQACYLLGASVRFMLACTYFCKFLL